MKKKQKLLQWIRLSFMLSTLAAMVSCGKDHTEKASVYANCPVKTVKYLNEVGKELVSYIFEYTSGKLSSVSISEEGKKEQVQLSYEGDKVVRLEHYEGTNKLEDYDSIVWSGDHS